MSVALRVALRLAYPAVLECSSVVLHMYKSQLRNLRLSGVSLPSVKLYIYAEPSTHTPST